MLGKSLLNTVFGNTPAFSHQYAILSAPVRHSFMIGTIWLLTKEQGTKQDLNILEIGSWYGASALSWVQGLIEHNESKGSITCVDAWKSFFDTALHQNQVYIEMEKALVSDVAYNIFLHNISTIPETINAQHFRAASDRALPLLCSEKFDVVFIDADHTYEPVKLDITNSLRLVREGGIICGDDLNLQYHQVDNVTLMKSKELDFIKDPTMNRNYHPGVTLAVYEIFGGEVSSWGGFWAMQKKQDQWVKIDLSNMPISYPKHFPEKAINDAKAHMNDVLNRC